MHEVEAAALAEFRAVVRTLTGPRLASEPAGEDMDPAVPGAVTPDTVWFRFACLAVKGGPCPAWRLSQCRQGCWRRAKPVARITAA